MFRGDSRGGWEDDGWADSWVIYVQGCLFQRRAQLSPLLPPLKAFQGFPLPKCKAKLLHLTFKVLHSLCPLSSSPNPSHVSSSRGCQPALAVTPGSLLFLFFLAQGHLGDTPAHSPPWYTEYSALPGGPQSSPCLGPSPLRLRTCHQLHSQGGPSLPVGPCLTHLCLMHRGGRRTSLGTALTSKTATNRGETAGGWIQEADNPSQSPLLPLSSWVTLGGSLLLSDPQCVRL